jgi:uncharacterized protein (TIGR02145 family)
MKSLKFIWILLYSLICIFISGCKPEEIILHGEISGIVTDTANSQPLQKVAIKLNPLNDTTSTGSDGKYLFKSLVPGNYEIEASKLAYAKSAKEVTVTSANTSEINFAMEELPGMHYTSAILDFGLDLTSMSFSISKTGIGKLAYTFASSKDWITVNPMSGDIDNETDSITVTINRSGLTQDIIKEWVRISSTYHQYNLQDTVGVYVNGALDQDQNYYKIVKIGTQTWMAENLNVGVIRSSIDLENRPSNNGIIEKYCYDNNPDNCKIYGGIYKWDEMMQYNPPDNGSIGTTQGICPVGWHIPTCDEWMTLIAYLGGPGNAGGALKETGFSHWSTPNEGATNQSGFSALGGGWYNTVNEVFGSGYFNLHGVFLGSHPSTLWLYSYVTTAQLNDCNHSTIDYAGSVRCVKDPPKK